MRTRSASLVGSISRPRWTGCCLSLALLTGSAPLWADDQDVVNVVAGLSSQYDSNLFRLPTGFDANRVFGKSERSDLITAGTLGLRVDKPFASQRVTLDARLVNYHYATYSNLDFTAKNYTGAWRWAFTPNVVGNLTADRQEFLNSFVDYRDFSTPRNLRTIRNERFDMEANAQGTWRLVGAIGQRTQNNSENFFQDGDFRLRYYEVGGRYVSLAGNSVTLLTRQGSGDYLKRQANPFNQLDSEFTQSEEELRVQWQLTGKTSLNAKLNYVSREHKNFVSRNYSGTQGRLEWNWDATAKTRLQLVGSRDLAAYQDFFSSYTVTETYSVIPSWQITDTTLLRLQWDNIYRDFRGGLLSISPARRDVLRNTQLSLDWKPTRTIQLSTFIQHYSRVSNFFGYDYSGNAVGVSGQITF